MEISAFDCVYSPAKRRGPIPGRTAQRNVRRGFNTTNEGVGSNNIPNAAHMYFEHCFADTPAHRALDSSVLAKNASGNNLNNGMFSLGINMGGISPISPPSATMEGWQQNIVTRNNPIMNTTGSNDISNAGNNFSTEQLKQFLTLQQQLLMQQQQMQQQQHQQGIFRQLAAVATANASTGHANGSSLPVVNTTLTTDNNPAATEITNISARAPSNFWNTSNLSSRISGMVGNNGAFGGLTVNSAVPRNNATNVQAQQQQAPAMSQGRNYPIPRNMDDINPPAKRAHRDEISKNSNFAVAHLPLLQPNNASGAILRSYYELSTNDVLNLPPIPTDEDYCARLNIDYNLLPTFDKSALQAARFSELALGALANNQIPLALELSNSSVMCLRNCVSTDESTHTSSLYNVARAYLLHGIFRSFRGDMVRYFKYRRVCMAHITQMNVSSRIPLVLVF